MAFKDLLKTATDKANSMASAAQSKYTQMQQNQAIKKEEMQRKMDEMKARVSEYERVIFNEIASGFSGVPFVEIENNIYDFTKEFYEKLLLPANSVSASKITMLPYADKIVKKVQKNIETFDTSETPLFEMDGDKGEYIVLTPTRLYVSFAFPENPAFFGNLCLNLEMVSALTFEEHDGVCDVKCNDVLLFTNHCPFAFDLITVKEYFRRIREKDYQITEEQIDVIIKEKIGDNILSIIKQYIFEDELLVYFAWGGDNITAKDFVVCTNKQILMLDREMLGMTKNVKQFYYEDITSMSTDQNTNGILDFALTAAFKVCNVNIYVAGTQEKIQTLFNYEAERVIRIYQEYRRSIKQEEKQAKTVVVQQAAPQQDDVFSMLEKLGKLKEAGILTEEEFNAKKADLLSKM